MIFISNLRLALFNKAKKGFLLFQNIMKKLWEKMGMGPKLRKRWYNFIHEVAKKLQWPSDALGSSYWGRVIQLNLEV